MNTYTVTVRVSLLEYYRVEAATPEDAMENWQEGSFLGSDDTHLDAEPLKAKLHASTTRAS